ncbi:DUF6387 family protein [Pseudomonas fluorescens]|uniref:DUF6387 family protein n=1 Tax=Pseudomonas fluorescens TaxID=294 RepID=UPI001241AE14|nr:DUF6387 family protein [Pseudomonas fluorescens]VVM99126.1 hypothetical protein PS639_03191 [Pseudomonas fluorescens]
MAKIDRVKDLPEWFDLELYRDAESFGAAEWHAQLHYRKMLLMFNPKFPFEWEDDGTGESDTNMERWKGVMGRMGPKLRAAPLSCAFPGGAPWQTGLKPVAAMTVGDLRHIVHLGTFSAARRGEPGLADHIVTPIDTKLPDAIEKKLIGYRPVYPAFVPRPALLINLAASDSVLKESFAAWLKEKRASQPEWGKRSRPTYDRWARYGLLPYIDLTMWAIETDSHIPDRVMSAAISHYDGGEANLRKTISPLAVALMRDLSELQALSAVEAETLPLSVPETFDD